jgi:zinc and cadmium transporter
MTALASIVLGSALMCCIALIGSVTLLLSPRRLQQMLIPLVSLAAGSLMGGALFHMVPEASLAMEPRHVGLLLALGFTAFLLSRSFCTGIIPIVFALASRLLPLPLSRWLF